MNFIRRIIACLLGIASPSRTMAPREPQTWLERLERDIDDRAGASLRCAAFASPLFPRTLLQLVDPLTGDVVKERDVSEYSRRSQRMRLNRWKRMPTHAGMTARLVKS